MFGFRLSSLKAMMLGALLGVLPTSQAVAAMFASSLFPSGYQQGTVGSTVTGYNNPAAALGAPNPLVGAGTAYEGALTPFNAHYESTDLVVIGQGGYLTLQFPSPIPVNGQKQIGVFTGAFFNDYDYPNGLVTSPGQTGAHEEYGAERSAIVEVATNPNQFVSLGRIKFDMPSNYYTNVTGAFAEPPSNPTLADFGKPFTGNAASFGGQTLAQCLATLNGSAGGNWIDLPTSLGLSEVNYIRFSDPRWLKDDGSTALSLTSLWGQGDKPADLLIDAVSAVPEPATPLLLCGLAGFLLRRRDR